MSVVVIPLPDEGFEPTEAAAPWKALVDAGHRVVFATRDGAEAACDPLLLTGVVFGQMGAARSDIALYEQMRAEPGWKTPIRWSEIDLSEHDALVLPGGHAKEMRPYLESEVLFDRVRQFMEADRVVGAICHGPLVLARAGVLAGRRIAALPKRFEWLAWAVSAWKVGDYYRTYPTYVEDEVREALGPDGTFVRGGLPIYALSMVVVDGNLITARWPGDAHVWGAALVDALG